jgi:hypothetical protein
MVRKRVLQKLALAMGLGVGLMGLPGLRPALADVVINVPVIIHGGHQPLPADETVVVEFIAPGQEWANVSLNGRRVFTPRNFNRRQRFRLEPGAYYLEITGFNRFEVWSTGYLDVGRSDSNVLVVTFSREQGVRVAGDPYAWLPDSE